MLIPQSYTNICVQWCSQEHAKLLVTIRIAIIMNNLFILVEFKPNPYELCKFNFNLCLNLNPKTVINNTSLKHDVLHNHLYNWIYIVYFEIYTDHLDDK